MMLNIVESRSELFSDLYMYRSPVSEGPNEIIGTSSMNGFSVARSNNLLDGFQKVFLSGAPSLNGTGGVFFYVRGNDVKLRSITDI